MIFACSGSQVLTSLRNRCKYIQTNITYLHDSLVHADDCRLLPLHDPTESQLSRIASAECQHFTRCRPQGRMLIKTREVKADTSIYRIWSYEKVTQRHWRDHIIHSMLPLSIWAFLAEMLLFSMMRMMMMMRHHRHWIPLRDCVLLLLPFFLSLKGP